MNKTKIDWCDMSWNPVTGCLKDCEYCYAKGIARRFEGGECHGGGLVKIEHDEKGNNLFTLSEPAHKQQQINPEPYGNLNAIDPPEYKPAVAPYPFGFAPTFHTYRLGDPERVKEPQTIFVCSMGDLFGEWVPDDWIKDVIRACVSAHWHRYLFLTKNPDRYNRMPHPLPSPAALGATAANKEQLYTAYKSPANWLSVEPLLEDMTNEFENSAALQEAQCGKVYKRWSWVVIGAETGNRKCKVVPERKWIEEIVDILKYWETPIYMKRNLADVWGEPLIQEFPWERA